MDRRLTWAAVLAAACFALGSWVGHARSERPAAEPIVAPASAGARPPEEPPRARAERLSPPRLEGAGRPASPAPSDESEPLALWDKRRAPLSTAEAMRIYEAQMGAPDKPPEESLLPKKGTGTLRITSDDGTVRVEVGYRDGVFHGPWTSRHADGRLHAEGEYAEGGKVGTWRTFHANGSIASETTLGVAGDDGTSRTWRPDGTQESEAEYEGGKAHGRHLRWHADGRAVAEDGSFAEGVKDGRWSWFRADGSLVRQEDWKGGALAGPVRLLALPEDAPTEPTGFAVATQDGKYSDLLKRIAAPDDRESYGAVNDYGHSSVLDYLGEEDVPAGWWVYVYPYWYVWGQARGVER